MTNGTVTPATQNINYGAAASFTVTPNTGYHISSVTDTCGMGGATSGTLNDNTYTTGAITGACTVNASFAINTYNITASAGANGSVTPAQVVNYGGMASFTVTPNTGYNGMLSGNIYSTGAVTGTCMVSASFADTTPPSLAPVATQTMLWPPNNKMTSVTIQANASDSSGKPVTLAVSSTCNESGKGVAYWTNPVIDQNTGMITLSLMAGRFGTGTGRVYIVTSTATDASGNVSTANIMVTVPHSQAVK